MEELPVDRGWAWVICGATFLVTFVFNSTFQVLSVTLLDLREKFDTSVTVISLVFMFTTFSIGFSSMTSVNFLVPTFGLRRVCTLAACVNTLCGIGYAFSPNVYIFIVLATIRGIMNGLVTVPTLGLMGFYFKKYRSMAITVSLCGASVSYIGWPPVVRYLISVFGVQGALLLTGALEGHLIVCAMLYRPLSSYRIPVSEDEEENKVATQKDLEFPENDEISDALTKNDGYPSKENKDIKDTHRYKCTVYDTDSAENESNVNDSLLKDTKDTSSFKIERLSKNRNSDQKVFDKYRSPESQSTCTLEESRTIGLLESSLDANDGKATTSKYSSAWSLASRVDGAFGVAAMLEEFPNEQQKPVILVQKLRELFDFSLFKNWGFVWCMLATIPSCANYITFNYLPTIGAYKGLSKESGALLLTIIGGVDLASRLVVGVLADSKLLRVTTIIGMAMGLTGAICLFVEFFNQLQGMITMSVLFGLFAGIRMSMITVMYIEVVGLDMMAKALSMHTLIFTIVNAAYNPLFGYMLETYGVNVAVYFSGILLVLAGLVLGTTPLAQRFQDSCLGKDPRTKR